MLCPSQPELICTQSVTVTQGNIDAGGLDGKATVTAFSPEEGQITAWDGFDVLLAGSSLVTLGKVVNLREQVRVPYYSQPVATCRQQSVINVIAV